jgi:hypothetical protein
MNNAFIILAQLDESSTIEEALSSFQANNWQQYFNLEYDSLVKNRIWTLVDLSSNWSTINCKWVLRKTYNVDGSTVRFKARLVAHGFF